MPEVDYHPSDPIVALATPSAKSALAVIRSSGDGAVELLASLASRPHALIEAMGHSAIHCSLVDPESGEEIDDVVLVVYRSPRSYTGEDAVDIMPHGSLPGIRRIIDAMRHAGFRDAAPGEFTLRAFLNGKLDLTQAEAVREIVDAKTPEAHAHAVRRLGGGLSERVRAIREAVLPLVAAVELALDYPEEETGEPGSDAPFDVDAATEVSERIDALLGTFSVGRVYQEGIRIAIAGATNVGKSSLFNFLLREERSIVSEIHGTTRDYIESWVSIRGIPVRLYDTAGLRSGTEEIESEGIRRTQALIEQCEGVIYLIDSMHGENENDSGSRMAIAAERRIDVYSKADLVTEAPPGDAIAMSSVTGEGLSLLEDEIARRFGEAGAGDARVLIESDHQRRCLERCRDALTQAISASQSQLPLDAIATDLADALVALGELTGEITRSDILDVIFSNFCVGK